MKSIYKLDGQTSIKSGIFSYKKIKKLKINNKINASKIKGETLRGTKMPRNTEKEHRTLLNTKLNYKSPLSLLQHDENATNSECF